MKHQKLGDCIHVRFVCGNSGNSNLICRPQLGNVMLSRALLSRAPPPRACSPTEPRPALLRHAAPSAALRAPRRDPLPHAARAPAPRPRRGAPRPRASLAPPQSGDATSCFGAASAQKQRGSSSPPAAPAPDLGAATSLNLRGAMAPKQPPTLCPLNFLGAELASLSGRLVFAQRYQVEDPDFWEQGAGGGRALRTPTRGLSAT